VSRDPGRPRPRRLAADVHPVGSRLEEGEAAGDGRLAAGVAAAVRERVGGDVEDADDEGALAEDEVPPPEGKAVLATPPRLDLGPS